MTPLLTWWPAMLAGGLALLFGWWWGRRSGREEVLLLEERYQGLQDRWDALQDEKMLAQQKLDQQQTLLLKLTARLKEAEATLRSERIARPRSCSCSKRLSSASASSSRTSPIVSLNKMPATSAN